MRCFRCLAVHLFLLVFLAVIVASTNASDHFIYPIIRVGRSSNLEDNLLVHDIENKRFGKLMVFPRVGRGKMNWPNDDIYGKHPGNNNGGMWFGPRLGRVQKRNNPLASVDPWTYLILNGLSSYRPLQYLPDDNKKSYEIALKDIKDVPNSVPTSAEELEQ